MLVYLSLVSLLMKGAWSGPSRIHGNVVLEEKELVFAMVVNRHGERTPDADELSLSDKQEKIRNLTYLEGLEGLTNEGKRRAYQIGKFIRRRYGVQGLNLISNFYLKDEIAVRSTDKERTKMTALVAMSAAYPPEEEQQWNDGVGLIWQPVPYSAEPLSVDYLRYYSNCDRFKSLMQKAKEESVLEEFLPYKDLVVKLKKETGRNFSENPLLFETLYDSFHSQMALGLELPEWSKPFLPRLNEAARLAYRLYFRDDEMKRIGGGVLLDEFLKAATGLAQGESIKKRLRIFSAHDFNIGALMDVARVDKEPTIPEYGAVFALELYRHRNGGFSVQPIYLSQAGEGTLPEVLTIADCGAICDLNKFREITKEFVLPEQDFYRICGLKSYEKL